MKKLTVERCGEPLAEGLAAHRWRALPLIEETELGVISWWVCERCPARTLLDVDSEDGFAEEPIVVYPPSCFEPTIEAGGEVRDPMGARWAVISVGVEAPPVPGIGMSTERVLLRAAHGGGALNASLATVRAWALVAACGCPSTASGDVVHLDGCAEHETALESAALMAERFGTPIRGIESRRLEDGRVSMRSVAYTPSAEAEIRTGVCRVSNRFRRTCQGCVLGEHRAERDGVIAISTAPTLTREEAGLEPWPEPASIVHPPTDPAPPSEELRRAMDDREEVLAQLMGDTGCSREEAERDLDETLRLKAIEEAEEDAEEPPTLRRGTPVPAEAGSSLFERVEALFGRPFKLGDDAAMDMTFDALGGIEG